jgi:cytochrome c oxidase subunit 2
VMNEGDYDKWLAAGSGEGSMAEQGESLFNQLGCASCHPSVLNKQNGRCPNLNSLFGTTVNLKDGSKVRADESYIRESVLYPQAKIVAGYDDIMPTFKGLISEDGLLKLVEYIKSIGPKDGTQTSAPPAPTQTSSTPEAPARPGRAAPPSPSGQTPANAGNPNRGNQ